MADIKLNLMWDINTDGDIEFSVSPEGSDAVLGTLVLDEIEMASELQADLEDYDIEGDFTILSDWTNVAQSLRNMAEEIEMIINDAKRQRRQMGMDV